MAVGAGVTTGAGANTGVEEACLNIMYGCETGIGGTS